MFFNKKNKMALETYSYYVLYIISNGAKNFFEDVKDFIKFDLYSEIAYYTFFTYISETILLRKYSENTVNKIKNLIIKRIIKLQYKDCAPQSEEMITTLQCLYNEYYNILKMSAYDFNKEEDLYKISKLFLEILELPADITCIMKISIEFASFIKFHTQNILNNNIEIIEK